MLALLCAVREPTRFLVQDRAALERRVDAYTRLLGMRGVLSPELAERVGRSPLRFRRSPRAEGAGRAGERKAVAAVRTELLGLLNTPGLYDLDRLDVEVGSTIDVPLQSAVRRLLTTCAIRNSSRHTRSRASNLLAQGNPADVTYTVLLLRGDAGSKPLRAHAIHSINPSISTWA